MPPRMNARTPALSVACGITTLLLVGASSIAFLSSQYGDGPGVGILGVVSGLAAGLLAAVVVGVTADRTEGWLATALVAYGTFGATFLGIGAYSTSTSPARTACSRSGSTCCRAYYSQS